MCLSFFYCSVFSCSATQLLEWQSNLVLCIYLPKQLKQTERYAIKAWFTEPKLSSVTKSLWTFILKQITHKHLCPLHDYQLTLSLTWMLTLGMEEMSMGVIVWEKTNTCLTASSCMLEACWASLLCCSWHFNVFIKCCTSVLTVSLPCINCLVSPPASALSVSASPIRSLQRRNDEFRHWRDVLSSADCRRSISAWHQSIKDILLTVNSTDFLCLHLPLQAKEACDACCSVCDNPYLWNDWS